MRYFIDTEFIDGDPAQLISVGVAASNGSTFYQVSSEFDVALANEFVNSVVLPNLDVPATGRIPRREIAAGLQAFTASDPSPEFWGFYAHMDWTLIAFCFGGFFATPQNWPMQCNDIRQFAEDFALPWPDLPNLTPHNALSDAL